jgi:hypothetical protein
VRLLDFFPLRTLLSFRLLSRETKSWVDSYPALEKRLYKTTIYLNERNLSQFLIQINSLPFTKFAFISDSQQNIGHSISLYEHPEIPTFLQQFGSRVLHLFVPSMLMCRSEEEFRFFQAMTNLQVLEINSITSVARGIFDVEEEEEEESSSTIPQRIPLACLTLLHSLHLREFHSSSSLNYYLDLIENSPRLHKLHLNIALFVKHMLEDEQEDEAWKNAQERTKRVLLAYLTQRNHTANRRPLVIDITSPDLEEYSSPADAVLTDLEKEFIRTIGKFACEGKVRFLHVPNEMLDYLAIHRHRQSNNLSALQIDNFFHSIVSIYGLSSETRYVEMPHLEEIKFLSGYDECNLWEVGFSSERTSSSLAVWPRLKKISLALQPERFVVVRQNAEEEEYYNPAAPLNSNKVEDLKGMMKFLFSRIRLNLEELEVEVADKRLTQQLLLTPDHFTNNFRNLKAISLNIKGFTNEDVKRLISIIPTACKKLESLTLSVDFTFQEDTFLGKDETTKDDDDGNHQFYLQMMKCKPNVDCRHCQCQNLNTVLKCC